MKMKQMTIPVGTSVGIVHWCAKIEMHYNFRAENITCHIDRENVDLDDASEHSIDTWTTKDFRKMLEKALTCIWQQTVEPFWACLIIFMSSFWADLNKLELIWCMFKSFMKRKCDEHR